MNQSDWAKLCADVTQPEMAKVCGVIWAASPEKPLAVFATKIEHVRSGLPNVF